jgi:phosphate transport system protein
MEREHISRIYDTELYRVRENLLEMGGKVEMMINNAIKSLVERDSALAEQTIDFDHQINHLEVGIDEKCLHVIATRQPTARDLRFITLGLKIVTDLERIGDLCVGVAKRALELNQEPPLKTYIDLPRMAHWAAVMVKEALDAFVHSDDELALKVCNDNQFVTDLNEQVQRVLLTFMMEDPDTISHAIKINYISKSFEQIADHATKIAEMVIFMIKGKDIRHTIFNILPTTLELGV